MDAAVHHLQESIRVKPDYVTAHYNLGNALARKGRIDEAISEFQAALSIQPDHADTRKHLDAAFEVRAAVSQQPAASTKR